LDRDLSKFDPAGWAPNTIQKEQVKQATMSDLEMWVKDLLDNTDEVLGLQTSGKALFTSKDLCVLYYGKSEDDISRRMISGMAPALRNAGFKQVLDGAQIRKPGGGAPERWWIVRQRDTAWTQEMAVRHLRVQK
jgi:hypothetical protein